MAEAEIANLRQAISKTSVAVCGAEFCIEFNFIEINIKNVIYYFTQSNFVM